MAIQSRVSQDRRGTSRIIVRQKCQITYEGVSREGVIVDLSLKGAFLSAKFLPPKDSDVTITLRTPLLKRDLILTGKVVRGNWGMSDHGELGRFGIRFSYSPLDLIEAINKLTSWRGDY